MDSQLLGFISFSFAALAFGGLSVLLAIRGTSELGGRMFLLAIIVQAAWAAIMAMGLTVVQIPAAIGSSAEALRTFVWTAFLLSLPFQGDGSRSEFFEMRRLRSVALLLAFGLSVVGWAMDLAGVDLRLVFTARIIAALFGFTGIAGAATEIAKIIFFVFIALIAISLIAHALRGQAPRP